MRFWLTIGIGDATAVDRSVFSPTSGVSVDNGITAKTPDITPRPDELTAYYWNAVAQNVQGKADVPAKLFSLVVSSPEIDLNQVVQVGGSDKKLYELLGYNPQDAQKKVSRIDAFKHYLTAQLGWTKASVDVLFSKYWLGNESRWKSANSLIDGFKEFIFTQVIRYQEEYVNGAADKGAAASDKTRLLYNHAEFVIVNVDTADQEKQLAEKFEAKLSDTTKISGDQTFKDVYGKYFEGGKLKSDKLDDLLTDYYMAKSTDDKKKFLKVPDGTPTGDLDVFELVMSEVLADNGVTATSSASDAAKADDEASLEKLITDESSKEMISVDQALKYVTIVLGKANLNDSAKEAYLKKASMLWEKVGLLGSQKDTLVSKFNELIAKLSIDKNGNLLAFSGTNAQGKAYSYTANDIVRELAGKAIASENLKLQVVPGKSYMQIIPMTAEEKALNALQQSVNLLIPQAFDISNATQVDGSGNRNIDYTKVVVKDKAKIAELLAKIKDAMTAKALSDPNGIDMVQEIVSLFMYKLSEAIDDTNKQLFLDVLNLISTLQVDKPDPNNAARTIKVSIMADLPTKQLAQMDARFIYDGKIFRETNAAEQSVLSFPKIYEYDGQGNIVVKKDISLNHKDVLAWLDVVAKLDFANIPEDLKNFVAMKISALLEKKLISIHMLKTRIKNIDQTYGKIRVGYFPKSATDSSPDMTRPFLLQDSFKDPVTFQDAWDMRYMFKTTDKKDLFAVNDAKKGSPDYPKLYDSGKSPLGESVPNLDTLLFSGDATATGSEGYIGVTKADDPTKTVYYLRERIEGGSAPVVRHDPVPGSGGGGEPKKPDASSADPFNLTGLDG